LFQEVANGDLNPIIKPAFRTIPEMMGRSNVGDLFKNGATAKKSLPKNLFG
jgi:hypothetical protein